MGFWEKNIFNETSIYLQSVSSPNNKKIKQQSYNVGIR